MTKLIARRFTGMEDYANAAYGRRGIWFVCCTVSVSIVLTPSIFHLIATQSLKNLLQRWEVSSAVCTLAVAALVAPLAQIQVGPHFSGCVTSKSCSCDSSTG